MVKRLTDRQKDVLNLIVTIINTRGFPPSIREISDRLGIYPRAVVNHLEALEKKGFIQRDSTARGIRVLQTTEEQLEGKIVNLPVVGRIAAGTPILAEENIELWMPVSVDITRGRRDAFLLRLKGDSMKEEGILDSDLVVVIPQPTAEEGEKVVALLGDEATVKIFHRKHDKIILKPANPEYKNIEVSKDFLIQGKVIGIIRQGKE